MPLFWREMVPLGLPALKGPPCSGAAVSMDVMTAGGYVVVTYVPICAAVARFVVPFVPLWAEKAVVVL